MYNNIYFLDLRWRNHIASLKKSLNRIFTDVYLGVSWKIKRYKIINCYLICLADIVSVARWSNDIIDAPNNWHDCDAFFNRHLSIRITEIEVS